MSGRIGTDFRTILTNSGPATLATRSDHNLATPATKAHSLGIVSQPRVLYENKETRGKERRASRDVRLRGESRHVQLSCQQHHVIAPILAMNTTSPYFARHKRKRSSSPFVSGGNQDEHISRGHDSGEEQELPSLYSDPLFCFYFRTFARLYHQLLLLKPTLIQGLLSCCFVSNNAYIRYVMQNVSQMIRGRCSWRPPSSIRQREKQPFPCSGTSFHVIPHRLLLPEVDPHAHPSYVGR